MFSAVFLKFSLNCQFVPVTDETVFAKPHTNPALTLRKSHELFSPSYSHWLQVPTRFALCPPFQHSAFMRTAKANSSFLLASLSPSLARSQLIQGRAVC